jgi:putative FmdB family regulatory protein
MPTYQFKCKKEECGDIQTVRQKYEDEPPKCKKCESETKRIISRSSFVLRGNGWFNTGGY